MLVEVISDKNSDVNCLGEGALGLTGNSANKIRARALWLEVARPRSGLGDMGPWSLDVGMREERCLCQMFGRGIDRQWEMVR